SALQSHTTTINRLAFSPCRKSFRTSLSANTIFSSASFLLQVPTRTDLSSFLSPADANVLVRDRRRAPGQPLLGDRCRAATVTPQHATTPQLIVFSNIRRSFHKTLRPREIRRHRVGRDPESGENNNRIIC